MNLYAIRVIELLLQVLIFVGGRISAVSLVAGLATWFVWRDSAVANVLLHAGVIVLMSSPILRVLLAAVEAIRSRDWRQVATIVAVVALLALTITFAARA